MVTGCGDPSQRLSITIRIETPPKKKEKSKLIKASQRLSITIRIETPQHDVKRFQI